MGYSTPPAPRGLATCRGPPEMAARGRQTPPHTREKFSQELRVYRKTRLSFQKNTREKFHIKIVFSRGKFFMRAVEPLTKNSGEILKRIVESHTGLGKIF